MTTNWGALAVVALAGGYFVTQRATKTDGNLKYLSEQQVFMAPLPDKKKIPPRTPFAPPWLLEAVENSRFNMIPPAGGGSNILFDIHSLALPHNQNMVKTKFTPQSPQSIYLVLIPLMMRKHLDDCGLWTKIQNYEHGHHVGGHGGFLSGWAGAAHKKHYADWTEIESLYQEVKDLIPTVPKKYFKNLEFGGGYAAPKTEAAFQDFLEGRNLKNRWAQREAYNDAAWCNAAWEYLSDMDEGNVFNLLIDVAAKKNAIHLFGMWGAGRGRTFGRQGQIDWDSFSPTAGSIERLRYEGTGYGGVAITSKMVLPYIIMSGMYALRTQLMDIHSQYTYVVNNIRGGWVAYTEDPHLKRFRTAFALPEKDNYLKIDVINALMTDNRVAFQRQIKADNIKCEKREGRARDAAVETERKELQEWMKVKVSLIEDSNYAFGIMGYNNQIQGGKVSLPASNISHLLNTGAVKARNHPDIATPKRMKTKKDKAIKKVNDRKEKALANLDKIKKKIEDDAAKNIEALNRAFK